MRENLKKLMKMRLTLEGPSCITNCVLAIICSNSFSHCRVDQKKKTVIISQMFNHVQLYVHLHLLNTRICGYNLFNSDSNLL